MGVDFETAPSDERPSGTSFDYRRANGQTLRDLSIEHWPTLPYSPYQNGKQEKFWQTLEGRMMGMLENKTDLTLKELNLYTQAWVEQGYNNNYHEEIGCTPVERSQQAMQMRGVCRFVMEQLDCTIRC